MTRVKVFERKKGSNSKIRGSGSWYQMKGLARRNTNVKFEGSTTYQPKVMTKVNFFSKRSNP
jgi:hypothetical protein